MSLLYQWHIAPWCSPHLIRADICIVHFTDSVAAGVQEKPREYIFISADSATFSPDDITGLVPVVKMITHDSIDGQQLITSALTYGEVGKILESDNLFNVAAGALSRVSAVAKVVLFWFYFVIMLLGSNLTDFY